MLKILMGPNVKILMGQSFGSWTHGHGPMALGLRALGSGPPPGKCVVGGGWAAEPRARAKAHGPRSIGPGPCVQEPKLWPMSILTFGSISMFSIPDF